MIEIKAPNNLDLSQYRTIFLAGSIEMDTAEHWQKKLIKEFENYQIIFINPRRDVWNIEWKEDDLNFIQQVNWELDAIKESDYVIMYFDPKTQSPITLLELGLLADSNKLTVCCPEGFWRRGNVKIICSREKISCYDTFEDLTDALHKKFNLWK